MKVTINAGGREVTIETASDTNLSHEQVAKAALDVWKQTDGASSGTEGPAYGFQGERKPSGAGYEREGVLGRQPLPVRAEVPE